MHNKFGKWITKTIHGGSGNGTPPKIEPPREHMTSRKAKAGFFELPTEIRRKILVEAFGNQILHVDRYAASNTGGVADPHRSSNPLSSWISSRSRDLLNRHKKPSTSEEDGWEWWSSVCYRSSPGLAEGPSGQGEESWADDRREGSWCWCDYWLRKRNNIECRIGVVGWLLASRQAYVEGVDVLYSTNTFQMADNSLILNLPNLLLPQRLGTVTSVGILWHVNMLESFQYSRIGYMDFCKLLDGLPSIFPHLRKLSLSLLGNLKGPGYPESFENSILFTDTSFLIPLDAMVRRMADLKECRVAIPLSLYNPLKYKASGSFMKSGDLTGEWARIWRDVPGLEEGEANEGLHSSGYWVTVGNLDTDGLNL